MGKHTEDHESPPTFPWAEQRRERRRLVPLGLVLGGLLACGLCGFSLGMVNRDKSPQADKAPEPTAAVVAAPSRSSRPVRPTVETLGRVARPNVWLTSGVMQYAVARQQCGVTHVGTGSGADGEPDNGQFCVVTVRVRNRSKQPTVFAAADQVGYTAAGERYTANPAATRFANGSHRTFLRPLPPWQIVTGSLVFDLPARAALTDVRLRSTAVAGSVTVRLV